jgi:hypothetical protein
MAATQRPSRETFIAFWKDDQTFPWRQLLFYILYPGCLAIYAFVIRWIDSEGRFSLPSLIAGIGYVVFVPYLIICRFHKRHAGFLRCPRCGDWFGQDASGAYSGPNPKFRGIIETGRCSKCGEQILSDDENAA